MIGDLTNFILANHPPLPPEEQLALARRARAGITALSELSNNGHDPTRRAELEIIIASAREARERIILHNTRLVQKTALKYAGRGLPLDDLFQAGVIGLIKAIAKFDPDRGNAFSTYATWWIRQTVTRALADQSRTIRLPVHQHCRIGRLNHLRQRLAQELNRKPTPKEIVAAAAEAGEFTTIGITELLARSWQPMSINAPVNADPHADTLEDFIPNPDPLPDAEVEHSDLVAQIGKVLDSLPRREAEIVRMYHGLGPHRKHTYEEIGKKLGRTRERIRQIEARAIRRLRHPSRARQLKPYLEKTS